MTEFLLVATPGLPLALAAACVLPAVRVRMLPLLALAPAPGLVAALLAVHAPPATFGAGLYRPTFALDAPGALLLGVAALLWIAAGAYAATYQRGAANPGRFAVCWLLALAGCLGVFVAADMPLLYLALALLTLGATGLVFHDETPRARRAAALYIGLALCAESLVLVAMVTLASATPDGSLLIRDAAAALPAMPGRDTTLLLLIVGFGVKAGLVPLHVWMPLAHGAAPMPASAVLSGAVVKAGIIGLLRFLPVDSAIAHAGSLLAVAGMLTALYAVAVGITQQHPKVVLAYSSVSQMGFVAAVIGAGIAHGDAAMPLLAAFYAGHHVLLKGAMFLLVGVVAATSADRLRGTLVLAAVLAVGLGGLPPTGGFIAKYAVKGPLGDGWVATAAAVSAVGTTLLMLHFVRRVQTVAATAPDARAAPGLAGPWLAMAAASLVVPWALYAMLPLGTAGDAFAPYALWAGLWPVLIGGALAIALARWGAGLPRVPDGDVVVVIDGAVRGASAATPRAVAADAVLRRWPAATLLLVGIAAALAAAITAGRG
ncbi:MAG: NADH/ubiquinone/plastoquinone (complex I) [Betaproteobacteria bacterium]|nr:NADH/ubiquinone/plastoquinone (complex I) [Betaproteobacteria bacterium]